MKVAYSISAEDYLTFQLFSASQSAEVKNRRSRSRYLFSLINLAIGVYFIADHNMLLGCTFLVFAVIWYFITPAMQKNAYEKRYAEYIKKHFYNRFDKPATLEIDDYTITSTDPVSTGKVGTDEIQAVYEIQQATYIKFRDGKSFILPKSRITNYTEMTQQLEILAESKGFVYRKNLDWKWK